MAAKNTILCRQIRSNYITNITNITNLTNITIMMLLVRIIVIVYLCDVVCTVGLFERPAFLAPQKNLELNKKETRIFLRPNWTQ